MDGGNGLFGRGLRHVRDKAISCARSAPFAWRDAASKQLQQQAAPRCWPVTRSFRMTSSRMCPNFSKCKRSCANNNQSSVSSARPAAPRTDGRTSSAVVPAGICRCGRIRARTSTAANASGRRAPQTTCARMLQPADWTWLRHPPLRIRTHHARANAEARANSGCTH